MSQFKIIHIISSLNRGGKERQLSIICKNSTNIDNQIIYFNKTKSNYISEYKIGDKVTQLKSKNFFKRLFDTFIICRQQKPDAIGTWGMMESIFGLITTSVLHIPMINFSVRHGIRKNKLAHRFRTFLLHLSKNIVANSRAGLKANHLAEGFVLYNGIGNIPAPIDAEKKNELKFKRLTQKNTIILISVANLVPYKDYFTVLKALKEIKEKGYNFYYLIIGDGPNRKEIENLIKQYQLSNNIKLTGRISDVDYYLETADIMIHSSLGEGCSNAILEGMKHGLPIIATDVGGNPEITTEVTAFLFDYGDKNKLIDLLVKLITDKSLRKKMGRNSYQIIKNKFTINKMIANYEEYILKTIK